MKHQRWPRRFKTRRIVTRGAAVYVIASPEHGRYKVGRARDPARRLAQMQTGSPVELKLMARTVIGSDGIDPIELERTLHSWLRPYRSHGEWFETTRQRMTLAWHQVAGELLARNDAQKIFLGGVNPIITATSANVNPEFSASYP